MVLNRKNNKYRYYIRESCISAVTTLRGALGEFYFWTLIFVSFYGNNLYNIITYITFLRVN